jgi:2-oxoglutarate ferredoxin oxidoreductase subunit alpha
MQQAEVDQVTIHFAGDSGDGIQLAGSQFTDTTALQGNDLSTFPDFPAEIRAPIGTVAGVSGFQIHFGSIEIDTPGDKPDVLVVMNAAAFKKNINNLKPGGVLIADEAGFDKRNLRLAHMDETVNPLDEFNTENCALHRISITKLNREALADLSMGMKDKDRSRNMFVLGLVYWVYNRDLTITLDYISQKFQSKPLVLEANVRALKAGYHYGETIEALTRYTVKKAQLPAGTYRNIVGNEALSLGLIAASKVSGLDLYYAGYPITPASDILHNLARHKNFGVKTFQAEDEIAAITAVIGAAFGGALAVTATSGPGMALKGEGLGLAMMLELPAVIINVQRGGPSTGLPTKTEQADLLQAVNGRNGEAPIPVLAARSASDCFNIALEAARIAIEYMTPVILLSDGYIANGSEPWRFPKSKDLTTIQPKLAKGDRQYVPYERDDSAARAWALPGTEGMEHRVGGLEKEWESGDVSYDPENHQKMVEIRAQKVQNVKHSYKPLQFDQGDDKGDVLVLGWGSTYGAIRVAVKKMRTEGYAVSHLHLRHLFPFAKDLGGLLKNFKKVLIPELNNGQLIKLVQAEYQVDAIGLHKIKGLPFTSQEIEESIKKAAAL